jgi:hypothetical protein
MLEVMAGYDILPYVRYARASIFMLFFPAVALPFVVLSTKSLYVIGPLGLLAVFFFTLSFMALGYNYVPSEELLDKEEEEEAAMESVGDDAEQDYHHINPAADMEVSALDKADAEGS